MSLPRFRSPGFRIYFLIIFFCFDHKGLSDGQRSKRAVYTIGKKQVVITNLCEVHTSILINLMSHIIVWGRRLD